MIKLAEIKIPAGKLMRGALAAVFAMSAVFFVSFTYLGAEDQPAPLSLHYAIVRGWPERPPEAKWGETPGIAVDAKDHVWVFTRAKPPVQVYDADGRFIRAWGNDIIQNAHYIRLGVRIFPDGGSFLWNALYSAWGPDFSQVRYIRKGAGEMDRSEGAGLEGTARRGELATRGGAGLQGKFIRIRYRGKRAQKFVRKD